MARASAFQAEGRGFESRFPLQCAHVAQSVEHILGKDEVTGSIPVMGSMEANSEKLQVIGFLRRHKIQNTYNI